MTVTMPPMRLSKDELVAALESRRPWARQRDAAVTREHREAERGQLQQFRAKLREALKWDYETAKANYFSVDRDRGLSCPTSIEQQLDEVLTPIRLSSQQTYTISNDGPTKKVWWLLTTDTVEKKDLCA